MIVIMKFWGKKESVDVTKAGRTTVQKNVVSERVYFDWAAATPLLPAAYAAMKPCFKENFGNPSAIHEEGKRAREVVERARSEVARALQVRPEFVTFTAGGTEGNNLTILGTISQLQAKGRSYEKMEVITTKLEHPSVLETMCKLEQLGVRVKYVEVNEEGLISLQNLKKLVTAETVLLSVAYANSEIGTVQPLHSLKKILCEAEKRFKDKVYLHVDAAQAPLWLNCQLDSTQADLLVLDAAKCCGPKGVGVLVRSRRSEILSSSFGGGQESGLRPGTENVAGIAGAAVAIVAAQADWRARAEKIREVRDKGISLLLKTIPQAVLNGTKDDKRLANNINISLPSFDTEYAAVWLDAKGFAVSTKSACSSAGGGESLVVKTATSDDARASSTLRLTLGPESTIEEIKNLSIHLKEWIVLMKSV